MKIISPSLILLVCLLGGTAVAEPIDILGLPLGGKVKPADNCPQQRSDAEYANQCWIHTPVKLSGDSKWGMIGVPGSDHRPRWAAHALFEIRLARGDILESFDVKTFSDSRFVEILNSITGRFGQPDRESKPGSWASTAAWDRKNIEIGLRCAPGAGCKTTFTFVSAANRAARARTIDRREAEDAARPATP